MVETEKSIHAKLTELENEIKDLKLMVAELVEKPKSVASLGGILEGISVGEEEFKEAERSLFKLGV